MIKRSICILLFFPIIAFAQPQKTFNVVLDWFANPDHAPLFVAKEQGYFAKQGLSVRLIEPADPSDPPKLIAAGKADLAITYEPRFVLQKKAGWPLVRVGTLIDSPLDCLVVLKDSNIHSIKDLKGKTIGITDAGQDNQMLKIMLHAAGLSLEDVHIVDVHYSLVQALIMKRVDAATGMMRNIELIEMQQAGHPGRAFYPENYGMPTYSELIFIANSNHASDPEIQKFFLALHQGVVYLKAHPEQTWQTFAKQHPVQNNALNHAVWLKTVECF
ncbi:MAG: ABC transporter substrate-binding protein [Gammaproteobacteria bacterium]